MSELDVLRYDIDDDDDVGGNDVKHYLFVISDVLSDGYKVITNYTEHFLSDEADEGYKKHIGVYYLKNSCCREIESVESYIFLME